MKLIDLEELSDTPSSNTGFQKLELKLLYDSGGHDANLVEQFYIPVLSEAVEYRRICGYFSSSALVSASKGIAGLIRNEGQMKMLASPNIQAADLEVLQNSQDEESFSRLLSTCEFDLFDAGQIQNEIERDHLKAMLWMLVNGFLEIRFVIPRVSFGRELFHQKVGLFVDKNGEGVAFSGSINESATAWEHNIEQFDVYQTNNPFSKSYFDVHSEKFEQYWNNDVSGARTIALPEAIKQQLFKLAPSEIDLEKLDAEEKAFVGQCEIRQKRDSFKPRPYQTDACNAWAEKDYKGIFAMATGTGKTKTALLSVKNATSQLNGDSLLLTICVPMNHLIAQWQKDVDTFFPGVQVIKSTETDWKKNLSKMLFSVKRGTQDLGVFICSCDAASSKDYLYLLDRCSGGKGRYALLADEVHNLGAPTFQNALSGLYEYRLGLSATPKRYMDDEGTVVLFDYFEDVCFEFDINRALNEINPNTGETYLCPYEYHPIFTHLSPEELDSYAELTKKIGKAFAIGKAQDEPSKKLEQLYRERRAIINSCDGKRTVLATFLELFPNPKRCLIYCGDKEHLAEVAKELSERRITFSRFTGEESATVKAGEMKSEREKILDAFSAGEIDVLIAIKCLDEGVDVAGAQYALLLSSTTNCREFIQRRGRLLRRSPGKEMSYIYDAVVAPANKEDLELQMKFFDIEKKRMKEFTDYASNKLEIVTQEMDLWEGL